MLNTNGLPHIPYSRSDNSQTVDTSSTEVKDTVPESHSVSDVNQVDTYEAEVSVACGLFHIVLCVHSIRSYYNWCTVTQCSILHITVLSGMYVHMYVYAFICCLSGFIWIGILQEWWLWKCLLIILRVPLTCVHVYVYVGYCVKTSSGWRPPFLSDHCTTTLYAKSTHWSNSTQGPLVYRDHLLVYWVVLLLVSMEGSNCNSYMYTMSVPAI